LKDLNLPKPDKYATVQLIAFIHQLLSHGGFYDDHTNEWRTVENLQFIATISNDTSAGRYELTTRLTSVMNVLSLTYGDKTQLQQIYTTYSETILSNVNSGVNSLTKDSKLAEKVATVVVEVYEKLRALIQSENSTAGEGESTSTFTPLFTPRDLTAWILHMMRYDLTTQPITDILFYEAQRLFTDRLASLQQRQSFVRLLQAQLQAVFKSKVGASNGSYYTALNAVGIAGEDASEGASPAITTLEHTAASDYSSLLQAGLLTYERDIKPLNLVFFNEVLQHIAAVDRALSVSGQSLLLVGSAGSGRKSAVALIAHMLHVDIRSPLISANYNHKQWSNELRDILKLCITDKNRTILLIEEHHLQALPSIIDDINTLLTSHMLSTLYTVQEYSSLLDSIRNDYNATQTTSKQKMSENDYLLHRVATNLTIILTLDPQHPQFNTRISSNPALSTHTTTIWFEQWNDVAYASVAQSQLSELIQSMSAASSSKVDTQSIIQFLQTQALKLTPVKYIALLQTYSQLYTTYRDKQQTQRDHLLAGLQKLREASTTVDSLQKDAEVKRDAATKKQQEADQALDAITQKMSSASDRKREVEQLQASLAKEEAVLNVRKTEIEKELSEVQPILQAAKDAVGGIKKDNLNEIRALRAPPVHIRNVLSGVLTLMKQDDLSWEGMRKFLGQSTVKEDVSTLWRLSKCYTMISARVLTLVVPCVVFHRF